MSSVAVVIPTRNRPDHLRRLVDELCRQTRRPDEIIIVDSSDDKRYQEGISTVPGILFRWLNCGAHVCVQRNLGIREALSDWILLCDDDIGLPENYLEVLLQMTESNPVCGVACGLLLQKDKEQWQFEYPSKPFGLLWAWTFQLPLWGSVPAGSPRWLKNYFKAKGNHLSKAGWPVLTDFHGPVFATPYYSLGANLVKREWLLQSPFDESLDPHGIGDNYGVIAGFPEGALVFVTHNTVARHHQSPLNRVGRITSTKLRLKALRHFLVSNRRFPASARRWFLWSLVGRVGYHLVKGELRSAFVTLGVMFTNG